MNFLQIIDSGKQPPYIEKCIRSLKERVENYELITIKSDSPTKAVAEADTIRLKRAATDPELCYVDTDCFISIPLSELVIRQGVPYFGRVDLTEKTIFPDMYYFYVNGCCDYFAKNLPVSLLSKDKYSIDLNVLKGLAGFELIDDMSYFHGYTTIKKVIKGNKVDDELREAYKKLAVVRKSIEIMAVTIG